MVGTDGPRGKERGKGRGAMAVERSSAPRGSFGFLVRSARAAIDGFRCFDAGSEELLVMEKV